MARTVRITIDDTLVGEALLRDDVAPRTSAAIWEVLPVEGKLMHCTCSGECVFFGLETALAIDTVGANEPLTGPFRVVHGPGRVHPENLTCYVSAGDIVLTPDKAVIIVYGRRCVVRAYVGELPSNLFAWVRDPDAIDRLESAASKTLTDGARKIKIERGCVNPEA